MILLFRALRRHTSSDFGHFDEVPDEVRDKVGKPGRLRVSQSLMFDSEGNPRLNSGCQLCSPLMDRHRAAVDTAVAAGSLFAQNGRQAIV